jgi:hypothetical protein
VCASSSSPYLSSSFVFFFFSSAARVDHHCGGGSRRNGLFTSSSIIISTFYSFLMRARNRLGSPSSREPSALHSRHLLYFSSFSFSLLLFWFLLIVSPSASLDLGSDAVVHVRLLLDTSNTLHINRNRHDRRAWLLVRLTYADTAGLSSM